MRWKIRGVFAADLERLGRVCAEEHEQRVEESRGMLVSLLRAELGPGATPAEQEQWRQLRWDSVHTILAQGLVKAAFGVQLPIDALISARGEVRAVAMLLRRGLGGEVGATATGNSSVDWERECQLPPGIEELPDAVDSTSQRVWLLTGAAGFLGCALLKILLECLPPSHALVCLVRADDDVAASARLRTEMGRRGYWGERAESVLAEGRLRCLSSDLGKASLGLGPAAFEALGRAIDEIWHCGSYVNHVFGYASMKDANVGGMTEVIRLAALGRRRAQAAGPVSLHYISTISVLSGDDEDEGSVGSAPRGQESNGYGASKWVAEMQLREAHKRGLARGTITRPGLLGPDTRTGSSNTNDWDLAS